MSPLRYGTSMIIGDSSFTQSQKNEHRSLTARELDALQAQRELVGDVLRERYDVYALPALRTDLAALQQIVDDDVFGSEQEYEWSCVGVVFGDVLAAELGLEWFAFSSAPGTEPALCTADFATTLFPRAMLVRRADDDVPIQLSTLLDQLAGGIDAMQERQARRLGKNLVSHTRSDTLSLEPLPEKERFYGR
ncbi:MAG TPA: DUF3806 domain-containing protein [Candidatus Acidoferrum sp.]|nr:DUF3806 domain-containing protein [Candidatus Acidoferrum sp.]